MSCLIFSSTFFFTSTSTEFLVDLWLCWLQDPEHGVMNPETLRNMNKWQKKSGKIEKGPTIVGDANSDVQLMNYLGAKKVLQQGNDYYQYCCDHTPRLVLNKLEELGYRVVAMTGIGQTCIWTLHKES
ncbi:GTP cyclohydrolase 1 feedback regulatory protein-like isoform X3 [Limulus polyphemus]|uniref:GTP cyclohydrolase 1 feedback regulatory protein n=1 Tax=Limulus polyphemus TaxID=6850 RepID=A0ABM1S673_LIMPO|nr:GTP cyclohydrolase 1 feedback regulatory protein-like isoform X3 [Limulus polyphemus]